LASSSACTSVMGAVAEPVTPNESKSGVTTWV
jgi:hypothetical protein